MQGRGVPAALKPSRPTQCKPPRVCVNIRGRRLAASGDRLRLRDGKMGGWGKEGPWGRQRDFLEAIPRSLLGVHEHQARPVWRGSELRAVGKARGAWSQVEVGRFAIRAALSAQSHGGRPRSGWVAEAAEGLGARSRPPQLFPPRLSYSAAPHRPPPISGGTWRGSHLVTHPLFHPHPRLGPWEGRLRDSTVALPFPQQPCGCFCESTSIITFRPRLRPGV